MKTSLAPGSQVVTDYLNESGLSEDLNALGFDLVGYGCTTCIGNSGPLPEPISKAINDNDLVAVSVLSGNRNFEGRVSPDCRANYLASPPLVVAFALKGTVRTDMVNEPIGTGSNGEPVYLKDIWPSNEEVRGLIDAACPFGDVPPPLCRRLSRRRSLARDRDHRRRDLRLARAVHLHPEPALFHRHDDDARRRSSDIDDARRAGGVRGFDHHRPHFAGGRDQAGQPGRPLSPRASASRAPSSTATARAAATTK